MSQTLFRDSDAYAHTRVKVLRQCQVHDRQKGAFFLRLTPTKERHRGLVVHKDACGRRICIEGVRK